MVLQTYPFALGAILIGVFLVPLGLLLERLPPRLREIFRLRLHQALACLLMG